MMTVLVVVLAQIMGVVALGLRLGGRVRHEQARGRTLIDLASALHAGGRVDEQRPDGTRLAVSVPTRRAQDNNG
jgi:hypothetical protein